MKTWLETAQEWTKAPFDNDTILGTLSLIESNPSIAEDSFYTSLEFGTGGLRGKLGIGTNRMNLYTVGMTTQGLANYINKQNLTTKSVVIAHDPRNFSKEFTQRVAEILSANGITAYIFEELKPTPLLSFAVRELNATAGIVITASHNPKEYNGYKVYWSDGAQIISPQDKEIISEVRAITSISDIKTSISKELIKQVPLSVEQDYLSYLISLDVIKKEDSTTQKSLSIVYTPIHGTGVRLVPKALSLDGFDKVSVVESQCEVNGNFPTVKSPNPEESEALSMAIALAKEIKGDIVLATDPDADRVGVALRNANGEYVLLNGNQTASILIYSALEGLHSKNAIPKNGYIVKTIVTTPLLESIASNYKVPCYNVLTGFKYIAEVIEREKDKLYLGGGEESYGYLFGDKIRDKDAVMSCLLIARVAHNAHQRGKTLLDILEVIYAKYGYYKEHLVSLTKEGKTGLEAIKELMLSYRKTPPKVIDGIKVVAIYDYLQSSKTIISSSTVTPILLPKSDVLQFELECGSLISVRPSGTEPKIKYYFSVKSTSMDNSTKKIEGLCNFLLR